MPDCKSCKESRQSVEPVPYIVHESAMARQERTIKRLIITLMVIIFLWFATIGGFVWYLNQYDFESYVYEQDGEGLDIIGDRNGVDFHVSESDGASSN